MHGVLFHYSTFAIQVSVALLERLVEKYEGIIGLELHLQIDMFEREP